MRSKEEIAAISHEIERNVSRKIKLEEMAETAKRLAKAYQPELLSGFATLSLLNGGDLVKGLGERNLSAIIANLKVRESFYAYRKCVQEKICGRKGT